MDLPNERGSRSPTPTGSPRSGSSSPQVMGRSDGDLRRIRLIQGMEDGGLPLEGIGGAVRKGDLSFGFLDLPSWNWYGGFTRHTFRSMSAEAGVNVELLQTLRESMGFARPEPDDLIHEEETEFIPVLKVVADAGADREAVER